MSRNRRRRAYRNRHRNRVQQAIARAALQALRGEPTGETFFDFKDMTLHVKYPVTVVKAQFHGQLYGFPQS